MSKKKSILDLLAQEVAGLGNAEQKRVLNVLKQAEEELEGALGAWLKTIPDGGERFTALHYRQALVQIRGIRVSFGKVGKSLSENVKRAGEKAQELSGEHLKKEWEHFEYRPLPIEVAGRLGTLEKTLLHRYRKLGSLYSKETRKWITKQLAVGVLKGETFDQLTNRLVRLSGPKRLILNKPLPKQIARGILSFPRYRASMIVRTEALSAYNFGHLHSIKTLSKKVPGLKKRWDSTLDRRGCLVCRGLDNEIQEVSEVFSSGDLYPPQHPHCRCTVVAWMKHWK